MACCPTDDEAFPVRAGEWADVAGEGDCDRSSLASLFLAACLVVVTVGCSRPAADRSEVSASGYNVVLLTIDTLRADRLGAYGYRAAETPALDSLAQSGVRFDQAMSAVPLTLPSHATILTGQLPQHHGVRNNGAGSLPEKWPTLATTLASRGYRTGAFVGSFVLDHRFGLARGFDRYDDEIERNPENSGGLEAERPADQVIDRALSWIDQPGAKPFFAWVHLYDAHAPYLPPQPYRDRFRDRPYDGEIAWVDRQVGRLVAHLAERGLSPRTIIVIAGDHGEALGEHGELTHGLLLYESTLRVPMIWNAPGVLPRGRVIRGPVSLTDVAPTLYALLGIPSDPSEGKIDGADLTAAIRSGEAPLRTLFAETEYPAVFGWSPMWAVRRGRYKYIDAPRPELFDLAADPTETTNVRNRDRRIVHELAPSLAAVRRDAVDAHSGGLDPETEAKLASLGYVGGTVRRAPGEAMDPKDAAPLFHRFEEANGAIHEGRLEEAIVTLTDLLQLDPSNAVFRGSLARVWRQKGELDRAIQLYREAIAAAPDDPEAWYNLAVTFQEAGRLRESGEAVREAIRRDPGRPEAHNALGVAFAAAGEFQSALGEFDRAIALDPRNARAYNNRGNVLREQGDLDRAAEAYRKSIELAPRYADPYNGLGTVEVRKQEPVEAIAHFDRALELAPEYHEVLLNRGIALELQGRISAAATEYRQFLSEVGSDPEYRSQRKAAAELLARIDRAGPVPADAGGR